MKFYFGKRNSVPARRHRLVIQEREYETWADARRAIPQIERYWKNQGLANITVFTYGYTKNGKPKLYIARHFTLSELEKAGITPQELGYSEFCYSWRIRNGERYQGQGTMA
jgi:hypothetical protein